MRPLAMRNLHPAIRFGQALTLCGHCDVSHAGKSRTHRVGMRMQAMEVTEPRALARVGAARGDGEEEARGESIRSEVLA